MHGVCLFREKFRLRFCYWPSSCLMACTIGSIIVPFYPCSFSICCLLPLAGDESVVRCGISLADIALTLTTVNVIAAPAPINARARSACRWEMNVADRPGKCPIEVCRSGRPDEMATPGRHVRLTNQEIGSLAEVIHDTPTPSDCWPCGCMRPSRRSVEDN
jgi:hypothetical protein